jgi:hypothetical protein
MMMMKRYEIEIGKKTEKSKKKYNEIEERHDKSSIREFLFNLFVRNE